jgi:hypothetical protein
LSSTAFWAWILESERSDDEGLQAINADLRTKLEIPEQARLESIDLERNPDDPGLKTHPTLDAEDAFDDRKRMDIHAVYRLPDNELLHYIIENKVRRDPGVLDQVAGYRNRLQRRVTGTVRASVFTFDDALASSSSLAERTILVLTLSEMIKVLEPHARSHTLLKDYLDFLKDRLTKLSVSPVRGIEENNSANIAKWSIVAAERGIESLIENYVISARRLGFSVTHSAGRSIFLSMGNRAPIVSVWPSSSSAVNGLWLAVSITNFSDVHHASLSGSEMPNGFAWKIFRQSNNEWRFGYVGGDDIEPVLRMISEKVSRKY